MEMAFRAPSVDAQRAHRPAWVPFFILFVLRVHCSRGKRQKAAAVEQTYLGQHPPSKKLGQTLYLFKQKIGYTSINIYNMQWYFFYPGSVKPNGTFASSQALR